jgi:hypothetical protein
VDSLYWSKFMTLVLSGNWASETLRARLAVKLGAELAADLEPAYPADNPTVVQRPWPAARRRSRRPTAGAARRCWRR